MSSLVDTAEHDIAVILKKLELDADAVVDFIEVYDLDVTKLIDSRQQFRRQVRITLKRNPGTDWGV